MSEQTVNINYSGNSHKERDAKAAEEAKETKEEPRVQKLEGVNATTRKKPLGRKIAETFSGDDIGSVGQFVLFEVMIPAAKNMLFDVFTQGLERSLFGSSTRRVGNGIRTVIKPQVAYNRMSSGGATVNPAGTTANTVNRRVHDFDELIFADRGMTEEVLENLRNLIEEYGNAKVADLKELCDKPSEFTDNKWGWDDLRDARVRNTRGGYVIDFPRTVQLS